MNSVYIYIYICLHRVVWSNGIDYDACFAEFMLARINDLTIEQLIAQGLENLARVNGKMALVGMVGVLGDQDQGESDYKDALLALGTRDWDAHVRGGSGT